MRENSSGFDEARQLVAGLRVPASKRDEVAIGVAIVNAEDRRGESADALQEEIAVCEVLHGQFAVTRTIIDIGFIRRACQIAEISMVDTNGLRD
jgi:hypothetical protein